MSNLEHLIENTFVFLDENPKASYDAVFTHVKQDENIKSTYIDARDICNICFYVRFILLRSLYSQIHKDIKERVGYARSIKVTDLEEILARHLSGGLI